MARLVPGLRCLLAPEAAVKAASRQGHLAQALFVVTAFRRSAGCRRLQQKTGTMYDYRKLTADQRQAVVERRRARGFPWHKPPHLDLGEGWYFITAATYEHRKYFAAPQELTALEGRLLEAFADKALPCAGWVVLPNHYHVLVYAASPAVVGRSVGLVHGRSAHYVNGRDQARGRQVWYKFSDRKVRSQRHFFACLHYILFNPVKHQYVPAMADWPWSCFAEVLAEYGADWIEDLSRAYPLGNFGKGWDD